MGEKEADKANDEAAEKLIEAFWGPYEAVIDSVAAARGSNTQLSRSFVENSVGALEAQAELNRYTLQSLANLVREQQEAFRELALQSLDAYDGFLDSLFSYYKEVLEEPAGGELVQEDEEPADLR
jgi:pyrroloquinoline quinone (PQQ) biosynthesis protein C